MFLSWKSCSVLVVDVAAASTEPLTVLTLSVFVDLSPDGKRDFRDHVRPVKPETQCCKNQFSIKSETP